MNNISISKIFLLTFFIIMNTSIFGMSDQLPNNNHVHQTNKLTEHQMRESDRLLDELIEQKMNDINLDKLIEQKMNDINLDELIEQKMNDIRFDKLIEQKMNNAKNELNNPVKEIQKCLKLTFENSYILPGILMIGAALTKVVFHK